jgi:hypothetical protein
MTSTAPTQAQDEHRPPRAPSNTRSHALGNSGEVRYKSNVRSIERAFDLVPRSSTMNVSTLEAPGQERQSTVGRPPVRRTGATVKPAGPARPLRPARRSGRSTGPSARPPRPLATPVLRSGAGGATRSCSVAAPAPLAPTRSWRLTDRAIALVLVTGLLVVTAALAVVGLTAVRVTGERFHAAGSSSVVAAADTP